MPFSTVAFVVLILAALNSQGSPVVGLGLEENIQSINSTSHNNVGQGWTPSPNGRGSFDIIWVCVLTLVLCCWTSLCLNVPPPTWGRWRKIHQKVIMSSMSGLGPEFTFQLALGQWASARRSVEDFRRSGHPQWSLRHAFLAEMGGFVLRSPDFVEFPLNAKQVHYLVTHMYIPFSAVCIDPKVIADKNKRDGLARFIAVCQVLWFTLNCFARLFQNLAITTMELSLLAFILCTLGTYILWSRKPMDIGSPIVLIPNVTLAEILVRGGDEARKPYRCTPLDFVGREHSSWYLYWTYWMNIARRLRLAFPLKRGPIDMIPDDNFPPLSCMGNLVVFVFQLTYAGIHLCAWNFHFPTGTERLLWRIAALYILSSILLYWVIDLCSKQVVASCPADEPYTKMENIFKPAMRSSRLTARIKALFSELRNNTPGDDPAMAIPLRALMPVTTLGAGYCIARAYIVLESWLSLRNLDPSAYKTVDWTLFLPHVQ